MAKFITDRILTVTKDTKASLKDAKGSEIRSLDDILAEIGRKNQQVKTAAAKAEVKTAEAKPEVKTAEVKAPEVKTAQMAPAVPAAAPAAPAAMPAPVKPKTSKDLGAPAGAKPGTEVEQAATRVDLPGAPGDTLKLTPQEATVDIEQKKMTGERPGYEPVKGKGWSQVANPEARAVGREKFHDINAPKVRHIPQAPGIQESRPLAAETKGKELKVAKSIDFRDWAAEDVVKAWGQHGSIEKCAKNVANLSNDPVTYCSLLKVASQEAAKVIKTATAQKVQKTAKFEKLSKLTDEKKAWLRSFWSKLYPASYVDAMLEDY
jgi:hypothetical protein